MGPLEELDVPAVGAAVAHILHPLPAPAILTARKGDPMRLFILLVATLVVSAPSLPLSAAAQDTPVGDTVRLILPTSRLIGRVIQFSGDSITFLPDGADVPIRVGHEGGVYLEVRERLPTAARAKRGALTGAAAGVAAGLIVAAGYRSTYGSSADLSIPASVLLLSSVGAAAGAVFGGLVGALLPGSRWRRVSPTGAQRMGGARPVPADCKPVAVRVPVAA